MTTFAIDIDNNITAFAARSGRRGHAIQKVLYRAQPPREFA